MFDQMSIEIIIIKHEFFIMVAAVTATSDLLHTTLVATPVFSPTVIGRTTAGILFGKPVIGCMMLDSAISKSEPVIAAQPLRRVRLILETPQFLLLDVFYIILKNWIVNDYF